MKIVPVDNNYNLTFWLSALWKKYVVLVDGCLDPDREALCEVNRGLILRLSRPGDEFYLQIEITGCFWAGFPK